MTGIDRLRTLAGAWDEWGLGGTLAEIADEIERELREALAGHEDEEVEDVATVRKDAYDAYEWVSEHGGLGAVRKMADIALDVYQRLVDSNAGPEMLKTDADTIDSMMAEIDEAIVKRGKERTTALALLDESVPRVTYERHIIKRQRQIDESHAALRRRNERIAELGHRVNDLTTENAELRRRAMPEGMEWPRYESGEFVKFGDELEHYEQGHRFRVDVVEFMGDGWRACYENDGVRDVYRPGERVKRPAPKVLDADGAEIRVGDTVYLLPGDWCDKFPCYGYHGAEELEVFSLHADHVEGGVGCRDTRRPKGTCYPQPSQLTHRAPVLAADGRPLREGETVWGTGREEHEYVVLGQPGLGGGAGRFKVACHDVTDDVDCDCDPDLLTHERTDSWERITEDIASPYCADYCIKYGVDHSSMSFEYAKACDIVRRAKALAGGA